LLHNVVAYAAARRDRLEALIAVAQREYGENAELIAAVDAVHARSPSGMRAATPAAGARRLPGPGVWAAIGAVVLVIAIVAVLVLRPPGGSPGPTTTATPTVTAHVLALTTETAPPTATATLSPPTFTPAPSNTRTPARPTPFPTVTYLSGRVFDQPDQLVPMEYHHEAGILPSETITGFLRLKRYEWGGLVEPQGQPFALSFTFALNNTSSEPITLDLDERFYKLVDAQGRTADLVYYCCATRGEFLAPGREREIQLIYRANEAWGGKHSGASEAFLEVHGLLPILSASWRADLPVTAE
jgi:hypothetical protein